MCHWRQSPPAQPMVVSSQLLNLSWESFPQGDSQSRISMKTDAVPASHICDVQQTVGNPTGKRTRGGEAWPCQPNQGRGKSDGVTSLPAPSLHPRFAESQSGSSEGGRVKAEVLVVQSCLTLCDPMDCSPPGCSVLGILPPRVLEWDVVSFCSGSSRPRDQNCTVGRCFTV